MLMNSGEYLDLVRSIKHEIQSAQSQIHGKICAPFSKL